jgi:ParB-like chromosome segregation protein Spo0J
MKNKTEITFKKVNDLIPYINNSRTHDENQVLQIASSIKEFGFTNPILIDETNSIIAGHGRLMAAKKLNYDEVPTIILSGLSDTQKRAYIIADNKLALNAGWDNELLMLELDALKDADYDLDLTGFSADEINNFNSEFLPATEDDQGKLDQLDPKWVNCPHCGKEFDSRAT